ncbi:MAG: hypothetical protein MRJ96_11485 [Nitrospirales bacterium]|nr:hypothetical protein [Nitrospira sp.]MDR4502061.1 hypothetical protein [Nitrospirales bacterium]
MKHQLVSSLVFSSLFVFSGSMAQAALFDYAGLADHQNVPGITSGLPAAGGGVGQANVTGGEQGSPAFKWIIDNVNISHSAYQYGNEQISYNPYLDSNDGNGPAGLGVCQILGDHTQGNLTDNECKSGSADDNVTVTEVLQLTGTDGQILSIDRIDFRNAIHGIDFNDGGRNTNFYLMIDSGDWNPIALPDGTGFIDFSGSPLVGNMFKFAAETNFLRVLEVNENQFYIKSLSANAVPIPSAFILFATGLGALVGGRYLTNKRRG